jgi:DegV family protein with EDD domain
MKIGVVIDSACDLPRSYIDKHGLAVLPIRLHFGNEIYVDERDPQSTMRFYQRYLAGKDTPSSTEPPTVEEVRNLFLDRLILEYDRVLAITVASSRSPTFDNVSQAAYSVLNEYKPIREKAGREGSFALRVIDSKTLFTGQAVLVHETLRLIDQEQLPLDKLRPRIEELSARVYAHLIPEDLYYVYSKGREKGDRSVGWFSFKVGSALDMKPIIQMNRGESKAIKKIQGFDSAVGVLLDDTIEKIKAGRLLTKTVCMSYAGNPEIIKKHPKYTLLVRAAKASGVETMLAVMSTTAGINVGPGSFSLAYILDE